MSTIRLKHIAQETGVSISTVSRILNGDSLYKPSSKTAKRVIEAANKLGFFSQPNIYKPAEDKIVEQKVYSIGCFLTSQYETFMSPFFATLLATIQNELAKSADKLQYNLSIANISDSGFSRFFTIEQLDCAILLGRTTIENFTMLKRNIPNLVYAGANRIGVGIDEVICDGYEGGRCAIDYLISLGHNKIGFLGPTQAKEQLANEHRYKAFLDTMNDAKLPINQDFIKDTILTTSAGYDSALEMIRSGKLPTAIFCANDTIALGAMRAFEDNLISVPNDISVIGFENIEMSGYVKPALTTISVPITELGRFTVKILLDKIFTNRNYPVKLDIPFQLVERESCTRI